MNHNIWITHAKMAPACAKILALGAAFWAQACMGTDEGVDPNEDGTLFLFDAGPKTKFANNAGDVSGGSGGPEVQMPDPPCFSLTPTVDLGISTPGSSRHVPIPIVNCGDTPLCLTRVQVTTSADKAAEFALGFDDLKDMCPHIDFATGPSMVQPCCVPPGVAASVQVRYQPTAISPLSTPEDANSPPLPDTADLHIEATPEATRVVKLSAVSVKATCPLAKVGIVEGSDLPPQTPVHLRSDGSMGSGGAALKTYAWKVTQPEGSHQSFEPNSAFPNPQFRANVAGSYTFCLQVTDVNGAISCAEACQTVTVTPIQTVHVELLWDTPQDADQSDTGVAAGADMDLHLAVGTGATGPDRDCDGTPDPWFGKNSDCFWNNPTPQWGSTDWQNHDDPTLDLADEDGAGPEIVTLPQPAGDANKGQTYAVGVHYWNDNGLGKSSASVRVFILGKLVLATPKVELSPLDLWYVAKIQWPNALSGGTGEAVSACKQSADACAGGKMWQTDGGSCVTPCYLNPDPAAMAGSATPTKCAVVTQ